MTKQRFSAKREACFRTAALLQNALMDGVGLVADYDYTVKQAEAIEREVWKIVNSLKRNAGSATSATSATESQT